MLQEVSVVSTRSVTRNAAVTLCAAAASCNVWRGTRCFSQRPHARSLAQIHGVMMMTIYQILGGANIRKAALTFSTTVATTSAASLPGITDAAIPYCPSIAK